MNVSAMTKLLQVRGYLVIVMSLSNRVFFFHVKYDFSLIFACLGLIQMNAPEVTWMVTFT